VTSLLLRPVGACRAPFRDGRGGGASSDDRRGFRDGVTTGFGPSSPSSPVTSSISKVNDASKFWLSWLSAKEKAENDSFKDPVDSVSSRDLFVLAGMVVGDIISWPTRISFVFVMVAAVLGIENDNFLHDNGSIRLERN
jgi:hypothetical protein